MNKFLELLEAHCQWIAVGIGGVFLALMAWSYVLMQPVAVPGPNNTVLTPGNVDDLVKRQAAEPVQREISRDSTEKPPQNQVVFRKDWDETLSGRTKHPVLALGSNWAGSLPMKVTEVTQIIKPEDLNQKLVLALPEIPPTYQESIKAARATVNEAPAANAPPGQPVNSRDMNYVFYQFRIRMQELAENFRKSGLRPGQMNTSLLAVKVYRQEERPDGTWSESIEVKPLKNAPVILPIPPQPGLEDPTTLQFVAWIEGPNGQNDLVRPPFYNVLAGEGPWAEKQDLPEFDPEAEKARLAKERADRAAQQQQNNPPRRPPPGMTEPPVDEERPRGRRSRPLADDAARPGRFDELVGQQFAQVRPAPGGVFRGLNGEEVPPEEQPVDPMQPMAPVNGAPGGVGALPPARFEPGPMIPDIHGWVYDENVEEGRTYRYQVVYALANPLFGTTNVAVKDKGLETQFALWCNGGQPHELGWSDPVTIEATTEFFLATNNNWGTNVPSQVSWEVFKWANGSWQKFSRTAGVGDRITVVDTRGPTRVTFGTGATVVDIRYDNVAKKSYVLVLDQTGQLRELDAIAERDNARRKQLNAAIAAQPPAAAAAAGPPQPFAGR